MKLKQALLAFSLFLSGFLNAQPPFNQIGIMQANQLGGTGFDQITAITKTNEGVYLAGRLTNTADMAFGAAVSTLTGNFADLFLCKYDFFGNLIWKKLIGYSSNNEAIHGLAADAAGNIYATGFYMGTCNFDVGASNQSLTSVGSSDVFIAKYSPSGTLLNLLSIGGPNADGGKALCIDATGNIGLIGTFSGTIDLDPGTGVSQFTALNAVNVFVIRFNSSLTHLWSISVGGANTGEGAGRIACDASGNLFVCGSITSVTDFDQTAGVVSFPHAGQNDIFIASYSSLNGSLRWAKSMGTVGTDEGTDLDIDRYGNVFVTGRFAIGSCDFNPGTMPSAIQINTTGNDDIFLAKYSNTGTFAWVKKLAGSGTNQDIATGLDVSSYQNNAVYDAVVITGRFSGSIDMNPGGTPFVFNDFTGGFTAGYSSNTGHMMMAYKYTPTVSPLDVLTDTFTNVFTIGGFNGTANFAPYAGTQFQHTSFGVSDGFMTRLSYSGQDLRLPESNTPTEQLPEMKLFPNPASDIAQLTNLPENALVDLIALDGRLIREYQAGNSAQVQLDLSFIPDGVYLVRIVTSEGKVETQKLLIQH
ncbi:MAG: T9SS type A sorting domain-containing protein [Bacteroidia bacterium]